MEVLAQGGLYLARELRDHIQLGKDDEVIWVIPTDFRIGVHDLYLKIRDVLHTEHMISWDLQNHLSSIVDELFLKRAVSQRQLGEIATEDYFRPVQRNGRRRVV